jgi:L-asparagine oxygenase
MSPPMSQAESVTSGSLTVDVARNGFAFLKSWHPDVPSEHIVTCTGKAWAFRTGKAVHRLTPKLVAGKNTYSGMYGLNEFPFHTDMAHWPDPPRYIMLRCLKGHESVATVLADSFDVIASAQGGNLNRALVKPRRPLNGTIPLLSLYRPQHYERASLLRWDENFIVPASAAGQEGMNLVKHALSFVTAIPISLRDLGDTLFIDNWRMLHARSAVAAEHADRIIERAYFGELY